MRKIKLFIASSLDGFIARPDGSLDWLPNDGNDYGYNDFITTIDTTLMGGKTYRDVLTFGDFPYKNLQNFVFTRNRSIKKKPYVKFISEQICQFTHTLKTQTGKDIWLIGGGEIIAELFNANLIDEYIITLIPVILGKGIPLFISLNKQAQLNLIDVKHFPTGVVQLYYQTAQVSLEK